MSHYNQSQRGDPTFAIVGIIAVILLIGGAFLLSSSGTGGTPTAEGAPSKLVATESSYDFGTVSMAKGKVTKQFMVKNSTSNPITVQKVYTSCMCTTATLVVDGNRVGPFGMPGHGFSSNIKQTVAPGEEVSIEAVFDPAAHGPAGVGTISRIITVEEKSGGQIDLAFSATVTP